MDDEITPEQLAEAKRILLTAHKQYVESGGFDQRTGKVTPQRGTQLDFSGADLRRANFAKANFSDSDMHDCIFTKARLTGAEFTSADLRWADLAVVKLAGARLPARFRDDPPKPQGR
jgi:uncharacterized protein YjbI with pentapeptide repeats